MRAYRGLYLPAGRRRRGPAHQPLQFGHHSAPKPRQLRIAALCQATRPADQMRQACLPTMEPVLVHAIAVTHQNPAQCSISASNAALLRLTWTVNNATVVLAITHSHANTPC